MYQSQRIAKVLTSVPKKIIPSTVVYYFRAWYSFFGTDVKQINPLCSRIQAKIDEVNFQNGSSQWDTKLPSHSWLRLNPSHSWVSWGRLLKCFTLEIGYRGVNFVRLYFKRDVFQDRIRPNSGEFAVLFHYPNQMFTSKHTLTRQWTPIDNTSNYWMSFNIKRMEAILNPHQIQKIYKLLTEMNGKYAINLFQNTIFLVKVSKYQK